MIFHDFKKCIAKGIQSGFLFVLRIFLSGFSLFHEIFPFNIQKGSKKAISLFLHLKPGFFPIEKSFISKSSAKILWKRSFIFLKIDIAFPL